MQTSVDFAEIGSRIRSARESAGIPGLEQFADKIRDKGCERPSGAKISRIETGVQPVPLDIIAAVADLTGIPERELRPDLASIFIEAAE